MRFHLTTRSDPNRTNVDGCSVVTSIPWDGDSMPGGKYGDGFFLKWAAQRLTQEDLRLWETDPPDPLDPMVPLELYPSFGRL